MKIFMTKKKISRIADDAYMLGYSRAVEMVLDALHNSDKVYLEPVTIKSDEPLTIQYCTFFGRETALEIQGKDK